MSITSTGDLVAHEMNPRNITAEQLKNLEKSMEAYGDLSGIVFNRRTKKQLGGHQRIKIIGSNSCIECKYFDDPDKQGTVGIGHVITATGARHAYREVDWPKELEYAAMIAANSHGGEWNDELLRQTLVLISEAEVEIDPDTIGLDGDFTEKLFKGTEPKLNVQEYEKKALDRPLNASEMKLLPSQTSMLQLFFTITSRPPFLEVCKKLQLEMGTANVTETVEKAIYEFALQKGIKPSQKEPV